MSILWNLKLSCCLLPYLTCPCYSDASLVISLRSLAFGPSCAFVRKLRVNSFSNLQTTFSGKLPMCSSRGRLWISWGYAHDLRMMCQLAMALMVCGNTRFRQSSACCQVSGGLTGHGGGQTGQGVFGFSGMVSGGQTGRAGGQTGWRSDRSLVGGQTGHVVFVRFELGQKKRV